MQRTQNTNVNVDLSGSLITFEVARSVYCSTTGNFSPDLGNTDVRREFFMLWAMLHEDMAAAIRNERVSRDERKAQRRKERAELVGSLERKLAAFHKALIEYPKSVSRQKELTKSVCDGVRALANTYLNEAKKETNA